MLPDAAAAYYEAQQRLTIATLGLTRRAWREMGGEFDASWAVQGPRVQVIAMSAQLGAARAAEPYMAAVLPELDIDDEALGRVAPRAFVGESGDGRPVSTLLDGAVATAKQSVAAGASTTQALLAGGAWLDMAMQTLVADTARAAVSAAVTARPAVGGWVRMLQLPSCPRCAVLAGKFFRWNQGFQRHPRCDCRHIPATEQIAGDLTTDPRAAIEAGQVRGLSAADTRAIIEDGADIGQVINAQRGMRTAQMAGRDLKLTTEGTTVRGLAGRQLVAEGARLQGIAAETVTRRGRDGLVVREVTRQRVQIPRLRPESIYELAEDRADAVRLLKRFGYLSN